MVDFENPAPWISEIGRRPHLRDSKIQFFHRKLGTAPYYFDGDEWEKFKDLEPGLVIIDGLKSSAPPFKENDSGDMTILMDKYKVMRDWGHTVVVLHHPPKGDDLDARGSGAIMANCDIGLILRLNKESRKKDKDDDADEEVNPPYTIVVGPTQKSRFVKSTHHFWFDPPNPITLSEDPDLGKIETMYVLLQNLFNNSGKQISQKEWKAKCETELKIKHNTFFRLEKKGITLRRWKSFGGDGIPKTYMPLVKSKAQLGLN